MQKSEKKEKPTPIRCICGKEAAIVVYRGKKMVSCPNPLKCSGNFRTPWKRSRDEAISTWNTMIQSSNFSGR